MRLSISLFLLAASLSALSHAAQAWVSPVPDLVLYTLPSLAQPMREAARRFSALGGAKVHLFLAPPAGLIGLIAHHARADAVVGDAATLKVLLDRGLVRPASLLPLGSDAYTLITGSGTAGAPAAALLAARVTILPDPTSAASFNGRAVLHQAGLAGTAQGVADTPDVIRSVQANPSLLGLILATDLPAQGTRRVLALPVTGLPIEAAEVVAGQSAAAPRFLMFLAGPEGRSLLAHAGLGGSP